MLLDQNKNCAINTSHQFNVSLNIPSSMKIHGRYGRTGNQIVSLRRVLLFYYAHHCAELRFPRIVVDKNKVLIEEVNLKNDSEQTNRSGLCLSEIHMKDAFHSSEFSLESSQNRSNEDHVQQKLAEWMGMNKTHSFGKKPCADSPYDTALQVRNGDIFNGKFDNHGTYLPGQVQPHYHQPNLRFFMNCIANSNKTIAVIEGPISLEGNPIAVALLTIYETKTVDKLDCFSGDLLTGLYYLNCAKHVCHGTSTMKEIYLNRFNPQRFTTPKTKTRKWTNTDAERYAMLT